MQHSPAPLDEVVSPGQVFVKSFPTAMPPVAVNLNDESMLWEGHVGFQDEPRLVIADGKSGECLVETLLTQESKHLAFEHAVRRIIIRRSPLHHLPKNADPSPTAPTSAILKESSVRVTWRWRRA